MAKDPAINWYFDNWCGGTKGFSKHQKGCYMDLLEAQFYLGHLSLDQVKNILGPDFNQWNFLKEKFSQDEQGKFFNGRMELEKDKRQRFSEKQSANGSKGGRPSKKPKQNPNINPDQTQKKAFYGTGIETGNNTGGEEEGVGEGEQVDASGLWSTDIPEDIKLNEVQIGQTTMFISLSCKVDLTEKEVEDYFEAFKIQNLGKKQWYNDVSDFFTHFRNSLKIDFKNGKGNRTSVDANVSGKKGGTSTDRIEALKNWG